MSWFQKIILPASLSVCVQGISRGVIFTETGDPAHHSTTPGDNSGWQYEGQFNSFLGVPIAPHFFITAQHIGGNVGDIFSFHGDPYVTIAAHDQPGSDLRIWEVNHAKPFASFAPLSIGGEVGQPATLIGRGTQRGLEVSVGSELKGWQWGPADAVQRWGRNLVAGEVTHPSLGEFLSCNFDLPGIAGECHLSSGDSGGGMFILQNGLYRLAGINYGVDGPFRQIPMGSAFHATLYDAGGLEYQDGPGWTFLPDQVENFPTSFYCAKISTSIAWIQSITGHDGSLSAETYSTWQKLYFTPTHILDSSHSGPVADPDGDGITNLLEYACNLDPAFNERITMSPNGGSRGLPLTQTETTGGNTYLVVEYLRRTTGGGVTCIVEFSNNLHTWGAAGIETAAPINSRWEKVTVVDDVNLNTTGHRSVRLRITSP